MEYSYRPYFHFLSRSTFRIFREQDIGAEQINTALQQLEQVIQQNAAASEKMASTSEELSSQADQHQQTVSFFGIKKTAPRREAGNAVHTASAVPAAATPPVRSKVFTKAKAKGGGARASEATAKAAGYDTIWVRERRRRTATSRGFELPGKGR